MDRLFLVLLLKKEMNDFNYDDYSDENYDVLFVLEKECYLLIDEDISL